MIDDKQLKKILSDLEIIPAEELDLAEGEAKIKKQPLGEILVEKDLISDKHLGQIIADFINFPFVSLKNENIPDNVLKIVPEAMARKQRAVAFREEDGTIHLAMSDPTDIEIIRLISKKTAKEVIPHFATDKDITGALDRYRTDIKKEFSEILKESVAELEQVTENIEKGALEVPVVNLTSYILRNAYESNASDIHIEPHEKLSLLRYRIDGVMHDIASLPRNVHDLLVARLKILAKLKTDEHFAAQDGKIRETLDSETVDIRVSVMPIVEGEKVVMRLLAERGKSFNLENLGLEKEDYEKIEKAAREPWGMILATGPTGCGKSTTLYSILKMLNTRDINICTIEDPVEYDIEGTNQIQVNPKTNLTFANGLKSIIRQDPDVILVGEIRDEETANIAVNAAMTGHLLLSTLHTNDAATTLPRLLEMRIEPFLVASTVNLIIAQRLVRKICSKCIVSYTADQVELKRRLPPAVFNKYFGKAKTIRFYKGKGCPACRNTGYLGRIGIFEILTMKNNIRELIMKKANAEDIENLSVKNGMATMFEDGIKKVINGKTTLDEVLGAVREL
jgi:type IV pilus assembly protein PilB